MIWNRNTIRRVTRIVPARPQDITQVSGLPLPTMMQDKAWGMVNADGLMYLGTIAGTGQSNATATGMLCLPSNYVAGSNITIRVRAKVSNEAANPRSLDVLAYRAGEAVTQDIAVRAAGPVNLTNTFTDIDYVVDGAALSGGSMVIYNIKAAIGAGIGASASILSVKYIYDVLE